MKHPKLVCRRCGWYTFDFKSEEKHPKHYPYQDGGPCMGCGYVITLETNIKIKDSIEFEEGEG